MKTKTRPVTDMILVHRAQRGDTVAFEELMLRYGQMVESMALRMTRDEDRAEELANIAWTRAWRKIRKFRGESRFNTWVVQILQNLFLDRVRKTRNLRECALEDTRTEEGSPFMFEWERGLFCEPEVFAQIEHRELVQRVERALRLVQKKVWREILVLHYLQGISYRDIAQIMGSVDGTVMSRLHYARLDFARAWHTTAA